MRKILFIALLMASATGLCETNIYQRIVAARPEGAEAVLNLLTYATSARETNAVCLGALYCEQSTSIVSQMPDGPVKDVGEFILYRKNKEWGAAFNVGTNSVALYPSVWAESLSNKLRLLASTAFYYIPEKAHAANDLLRLYYSKNRTRSNALAATKFYSPGADTTDEAISFYKLVLKNVPLTTNTQNKLGEIKGELLKIQ